MLIVRSYPWKPFSTVTYNSSIIRMIFGDSTFSDMMIDKFDELLKTTLSAKILEILTYEFHTAAHIAAQDPNKRSGI